MPQQGGAYNNNPHREIYFFHVTRSLVLNFGRTFINVIYFYNYYKRKKKKENFYIARSIRNFITNREKKKRGHTIDSVSHSILLYLSLLLW